MVKGIITVCYRKIIGPDTPGAWEQLVHADTWMEFCMQAQYFSQDGKWRSASELRSAVPGAAQLDFLVSAAARNYILQLRNTVPDVLNMLAKPFLQFSNYSFEIIASHLDDKSRHRIAITFYSDPLLWLDTLGDVLLVAPGELNPAGRYTTEMFRLGPQLSINSIDLQPDCAWETIA
jgi:hypothetical protein